MNLNLTPRQKQILKFILDHTERFGSSPTLREIADHFGFSGPASVRPHLQALEKKGFIRRHEHRARGIELVWEKVKEIFWQRVGIPLVGRVAAGRPILAEENIEEVLDLKGLFPEARHERLFALRVQGDSMVGAGILEGDIVIVRPQPEAQDGDIVVAIVNEEEGTIKRFFRERDRVRLEPANLGYKPIRTRNVRIVGKVIGVVRHL